jgi:aspartate-semialdehyde dehydrogenase
MKILADAEGVVLMDGPTGDSFACEVRKDPLERQYPVTRDLSRPGYQDAVLVGRVRDDTTCKNAINLWCVSDNLRKGAATNAVQIAEGMLKRGLL